MSVKPLISCKHAHVLIYTPLNPLSVNLGFRGVYNLNFLIFALKHGLWVLGSNKYSRYMSLVMRKPAFCICEKKKDADQLRGNREADQRFCFRYIASTIHLLPTTKF